jgi:outer membrane protein assembly factor BamD (BamD/ComL family)
VRRQIALLERAWSLAGAGDYLGAQRTIDEYEHRYPRGLFSEEASLVRIDVARARDDRATAAALATRFLAEHPTSVHAERVRSLAKWK